MISDAFLDELRAVVGVADVVTRAHTLQHQSRDFYWFSPVLKEELGDKVAEVMVRPQSAAELAAVVAAAVRHRVPITPRGAGTGNYGQAIPLHGGLIISTKKMNRILELTPQYAHVEAGVILQSIELAAREVGAELRFFPSTLPTATAGGFLTGGSGGVGSITWGNLWQEGNVRQVTVVTIEAEPQTLTLTNYDDLLTVIHNCGLTCIVTDLILALAPAQQWRQFVVAFDDFEAALRFGESLAQDGEVVKRLITAVEWPLPSYFTQLVKQGGCPEGKSLLLLQLAHDLAEIAPRAVAAGGAITWQHPQSYGHSDVVQLTDFSWNHTTLWAIKADDSLTYLQDQFDPERLYEQLRLRKARYGADVLEHIEFTRDNGRLTPQGLSIVRFHSKEQLWELMDYCESIGINIANPHTTYLDDDMRWNGEPVLAAKARWDPHTLLNPGHLRALE